MDILWHCRRCKHPRMLDVERLTTRPVDRIVASHGYVCEKCGNWEVISYSNSSLDEIVRRLQGMPANKPGFSYHLIKAINKAENIAQRMESKWQEQIPQHG